MARRAFRGLRSSLLQVGVAPRHVRRVVSELRDHHDDIVEARMEEGMEPAAAERSARDALGDTRDFVAVMSARPELRSWAFRFPRLALVAYPLTCLALLPVFPVFAGIAHAPLVMRWFISLMFAGLFTMALLLALQLAIVPG